MGLKSYIYDKNKNPVDNCEYAHIYAIVNVGSKNDPHNKSGLAHFVEHMCLSYPLFKRKDFIRGYQGDIVPSDYFFCGKTDYCYTILQVITKDDYQHINNAIFLQRQMTKSEFIKDYIVDSVKFNILDEYTSVIERTKKSKTIINFLTQSNIKNQPIGNVKEIQNITKGDICNFINYYYTTENIALFIISSLSKQIVNNIINQVWTANICENRVPILSLGSKKFKLAQIHLYFFKIKNIFSTREKWAFYLFNEKMKEIINLECNTAGITVEDFKGFEKNINEKNAFFYIRFQTQNNNKLKNIIQSISLKLHKLQINENFILSKIKTIKKYKKGHISLFDEIFSNAINNFIYHEKILDVDSIDFTQLKLYVNANNFNNIIRGIIDINFKTVIELYDISKERKKIENN